MTKKIIKLTSILIFVLPVLFFLNTGFSADSQWKIFQTIGFSMAFSTSLIWPFFKKYLLILSVVLLIIMSVLFIFGELLWAETFGSTVFGLTLLLIISYIPQFVKKGYIERI